MALLPHLEWTALSGEGGRPQSGLTEVALRGSEGEQERWGTWHSAHGCLDKSCDFPHSHHSYFTYKEPHNDNENGGGNKDTVIHVSAAVSDMKKSALSDHKLWIT